MDVERQEVLRLRGEIAALQAALDSRYRRRDQLIAAMASTMSQRQIAAAWNISQPRVTQVLQTAVR